MREIKPYWKTFLIVICLSLPLCVIAQLKHYKFSQVDSLQQSAKKTVIVFIYTDWCKFCAAMKSTTFKDQEIMKKINDNFYFVTLNAEEKKEIRFNNYTFKYKQTGLNTGFHELAGQLAGMDKETTYPTLCFLNDKNEIIYQQRDFMGARQLATLLDKLEVPSHPNSTPF